jgi:formiminotetrahydrofolate cyclodeaminase
MAGVLGVSLISMVGSLTEGRAKYAEHAGFVAGLLEDARLLQDEMMALADEDAAVFNGMSAAYKMPKDTAEEKAARKEAVQTALRVCTMTPYRLMELCLKAIELTEQAVGRTNRTVVSDLGVAALCLKAAAESAWLNVLINVGAIRDAGFASEYREKGEAILNKALPAADGVYAAVKAACGEAGE